MIIKLNNMEILITYTLFGIIFMSALLLTHGVLKYLDKKGIINIEKIIKDLDKDED